MAKVSNAGICGSDVDILYSRNTIYAPPVVQGHEFSAIITEVGDGVKDFIAGDKIVSETTFESCGECQMCGDGNYHLCLHKQIVGWTENGGFAAHVLLNSNYLHKLQAGTDLQQAALIEPSAIACEGVLVKGRCNQVKRWLRSDHTTPDRRSIAIQPMSGCIDAFNNKDSLLILKPNEEWKGMFGIKLKK